MDAPFLADIDWQRPWLAGIRPVAEAILQSGDWLLALNLEAQRRGLKNHRGLPIRFVPQSSLPNGEAYEAFISRTGCVPTRSNLHDFFNALVWLTYPRIKIRLNALQAAEIEKAGLAGGTSVRGTVRDAATIFDENAALLVTSDPALISALRAHDWSKVFLKRRDDFSRKCQVRLFGHALMEKLVNPYKAITAHAWVVVADDSILNGVAFDQSDWIDREVASQLSPSLASRNFTPLPVFGIPGWCGDQDEAFYADAAVFRPKRRAL